MWYNNRDMLAVERQDPEAALKSNNVQQYFFTDYIKPWIEKYIGGLNFYFSLRILQVP